MSRLRASLSTSPQDQRIQTLVASAQRSIAEAMHIARRAKREGGVEASRSNRVHRDLAKAQGALANIRRLRPFRDYDDPDLVPEEERAQQLRDKLDAERLAELEEAVEADVDDIEPSPQEAD